MTSVFAYSFDVKKEKLGLAQAHDVNASYKDLTQVCSAIRRKPLSVAKKILEEAIEGTKAIPFSKFNKGMGHRSELGGRKGKYPKKECKIVLALVKNAEANALHKGLDKELLYVKFSAAYKQNVFRRYRKFWVGGQTLGYGKQAMWANYMTARAEIALGQYGEKRLGGKKNPKAKSGKKQSSSSHATTEHAKTEHKNEHKKAVVQHSSKEHEKSSHKEHEKSPEKKAHTTSSDKHEKKEHHVTHHGGKDAEGKETSPAVHEVKKHSEKTEKREED